MSELNKSSEMSSADKLLAELNKIDDKDGQTLYGIGSVRSVNDAIDAVKRRTPEGLRLIGMYERTTKRQES